MDTNTVQKKAKIVYDNIPQYQYPTTQDGWKQYHAYNGYEKMRNEIVECLCGSQFKRSSNYHHLKSKTHKNWVNNIEPIKPKEKKITCKCGSVIVNAPCRIKEHEQTKKHEDLLHSMQ